MDSFLECLLERLNERAHDPKRANDEAQGVAAKPLTQEQLTEAERHWGFMLPETLREVYLQVGNGGFGPGNGLVGLPRSEKADPQLADKSAVGLLPLCEWGSGIASYADCTHPDAPVIRLDPNMPKADVATRVPAALHFERAAQVKEACWVEAPSLAHWLEAWADGKPLFYAAYGQPGEDEDALDDEEDETDAEEE